MEIDVYKAFGTAMPRNRVYIMVCHGKDINELPQNFKDQVGEMYFQRTMRIKKGEKRIAMDTDEVISNIKSDGFHQQQVSINVNATIVDD